MAREATLIVLDVGENSIQRSSETGGRTFFERSKECASKIIQKKIFAKPNDEIGVVLFGSDETENDLNKSLGDYENIVELIPLQLASWEMVRKIEGLQASDSLSCDWVDALVVAMNFFNNQSMGKKFTSKRVIFITNFLGNTDDSKLDVITTTMKDNQIDLLAISDCVEQSKTFADSQFTQNVTQTKNQTQSQKIFMEVIEDAGGNICHIDHAEAQLLYFDKKATRSMPWNAPLRIGSKFVINVSGYVHIQGSKVESFKTECIIENTVTRTVNEYHQEDEVIEKPDESDVIKAYFYGSQLVTPDGDNVLKDVEEEKGLSCLAFFSKDRIYKDFLVGDGSHIVVAQKDCRKSLKNFKLFTEKMIEMKQVMIAKKVYNKNSKPVNVILIPEITENGVPFMKMIQTVFADDLVVIEFPPLKTNRTKPTAEQQEAVAELVNKMTLTDDKEEIDRFGYNTVFNPANQHLYRSIAFRALNPNEPLPTFKEDLAATIDIPASIKERCQDVFKELETQFPLEYVEIKQRKKVFGRKDADDDVLMMDDEVDDSVPVKNITSIGTVDPVGDFDYLLKQGNRFTELADQMQIIIYDFLFRAADLQSQKIIECLMHYREQSKLGSPFFYNKWIESVKTKLMEESGQVFDENDDKVDVNLWEYFIVKEKLGLIAHDESMLSDVTLNDQKSFYLSKAMHVQKHVEAVMDDDEIENMLE